MKLITETVQDVKYLTEKKEDGGKIHIKLAENVSFINKGSILKKLADLPSDSVVHIDGSASHYIDLDVLEIIHNFKETAASKNIKVQLTKIPDFMGVSGH
jgi:MFS superfamily sulfate permease-like transporter